MIAVYVERTAVLDAPAINWALMMCLALALGALGGMIGVAGREVLALGPALVALGMAIGILLWEVSEKCKVSG